MGKHSYGIIVFSDSKAAIKAQQALMQAGLNTPMMPTPRELTAHCGLSLRFPPEILRQIKDVLNACGMFPDEHSVSFYRMEYDEHIRAVTPME